MSIFTGAVIPVIVTIEYLMTLLNSNYEEWRMKHPDSHYTEFPFSIKKLSPSGCLFDFDKLNDIGREIISPHDSRREFTKRSPIGQPTMTASFMRSLPATRIIQSDLCHRPRRKKAPQDFAKWSDVKPYLSFFYDRFFNVEEKIEGSF